jgi:hypothetical protein
LKKKVLTAVFSIQYYKDTQVNWFAYTTLFNGLAAKQDAKPILTRPKPANWQDALAINTYWGFIHAQSYIAVINECLHLDIPNDVRVLNELLLDFEGKEQSFTNNYQYLTKEPSGTVAKVAASKNLPFLFMENLYTIWELEDDVPGRTRAGELHRLYMQWDRAVSKMIHKSVYGTDQGKRALRDFHGLETE